jgi:DNA-binding PadR family transcriptional regulator
MARATRVTEPLLDVATCLLGAYFRGEQPHGWTIMKATRRSGPTVYGVLDRLEDRGWVEAYWEELDSTSNRPRRRFYRLTSEGLAGVQGLLAQRRPEALEETRNPGQGIRLPSRWSTAPDGA